MNETIERLNQLYRKRIKEGLAPEEVTEEEELRKKYLAGIRGQVEQSLSNIEIVDDKGNIISRKDHDNHHHEHCHGEGCGCKDHKH